MMKAESNKKKQQVTLWMVGAGVSLEETAISC